MANTMSAAQRRKGLNVIFATGHTLKQAFFKNAYVPGQTAYSTTNESSGTGYTAGGNALTGATNATGTNKSFSDCADASFPGLTCSDFRWLVTYDVTDSNATVLEQDLGAQSVAGVDVTVVQPTADETHAMIQL